MFETLIHILLGIVFFYCAASVCYLFVFALASKFYKRKKGVPATPAQRIAVLVPAYAEDGIILSTAESLLRLDYPAELYDVYIIADSFQPQTLERLRQLPVHLLEVSFEKSTKTKSLNEAFRRISQPYDIALICDADNILARNFLQKINTAFANGAKAVQGRRVAKNLDTPFAILDACSEGINNNIFRKGANALGLSSAVIGSGMAFPFERIREILASIKAVGGFDKILQLQVVAEGHSIQYLEDAIIFDEKVDSAQAFHQQRRRWVSSQFLYLKQFFAPAMQQLLKGNGSYFNLAIANNLVLPRAFLFILLPLLLVAGWIVGTGWGIGATLLCGLYLLTLVLALPSELVNRDFYNALLRLPRAVLLMAGTLFGMKKANKTFIHTVHTKTEINNPLFKEHAQ